MLEGFGPDPVSSATTAAVTRCQGSEVDNLLPRFCGLQAQFDQSADGIRLGADLLLKPESQHPLPLFGGELKRFANRICCFHAININYMNRIDNGKPASYE
jgi:hypothetical protein